MSSIAYITDSKLIELHRLNNNSTMNFWRLSTNINFSDFGINDLVFFLSKDKAHLKGKEKGIVGYGRVVSINVSSVKKMWDNYGVLNGYNTLNDFKEAIIKVSKDKALPKKISSFYLEDVTFFSPIYLSECGMEISNNIESYIYLKPEHVTINLLELTKKNADIWSNINEDKINEEELLYSLNVTHQKIKDIPSNKKAKKYLINNYPDYKFVYNSKNEVYKIDKSNIEIIFYRDKDTDDKQLMGQARLYRYYLSIYYSHNFDITFKTTDKDSSLEYLLNN